MNKLYYLKQYERAYVFNRFGKYGRSSGIKPGVMWPRKEELEHLKLHEKCFQPSLEELKDYCYNKKTEREEKRKKREEEVYAKLKKLPSELENFFGKIEEKKIEKEEWLKKKELAIEEVREILGYTAKPSDPKFLEALAQREEDAKKAKRKEERKKRENAKLESLFES